MNTEQQDRLWNELSEEKQKSAREMYKQITKPLNPAKSNAQNEADIMSFALETTFGSHNLNPKQIKTWEDVEKEYYIETLPYPISHTPQCRQFGIFTPKPELLNSKVSQKAIATLKIAKLIDLGYGGMVSEEENNDTEIEKYAPFYYEEKGFVIECLYRSQDRVLCFHTQQQAEKFMSYESNIKLVEQYHMM